MRQLIKHSNNMQDIARQHPGRLHAPKTQPTRSPNEQLPARPHPLHLPLLPYPQRQIPPPAPLKIPAPEPRPLLNNLW